jgi:hypothetical protein
MKIKLNFKHLVFFSLIIFVGCSNDSKDNEMTYDPNLYTYVPDDNFEQLLINQGYDTNLDDYVLTANIINVTSLLFTNGGNGIINSSGITNFTGIEDFISLESFDCSFLNLSQLDLSNNIALKIIDCSANNLTTLDLSNLVNLENLNAGGNQLTTLDISNNTALLYLSCGENPLTCIQVNEEQLQYDFTNCSQSLFSLDCN